MNSLVTDAILEEYQRATKKFGKFASPHEGIGILREEYLELEREVFWGKDRDRVTAEAIQVGAMALRFLVDVCGCPNPFPENKEADNSASDNTTKVQICPECEGLGYTEPTLQDPDGLCPKCRGAGKL